MKCTEQEECTVLVQKNPASDCSSKDQYINYEKSKVDVNIENFGIVEIVKIPKWIITLTSNDDCVIKKRLPGWEVSSNIMEREKESQELISLKRNSVKLNIEENEAQIQTVDTEIYCDRGNLTDLLNDKDEPDHGIIIPKTYLKLLPNEEARINFIVKVLSKAIDEHKMFIICGTFPILRKPLMKRGWIEKRTIRRMISIASESNDERVEKLLRYPADLIWYTNKKASTIRTDEKTIVNKFAGSYFTSKVDMCNNLENVYWFYEPGVSNVQFPRCYNIYQPAQVEEFIQDYYITACTGILKWFLLLASVAGQKATWSLDGTVPVAAILFALERCVEYISVQQHEDIDRNDYKTVTCFAWNQFLDWYQKIINEQAILKETDNVDINGLFKFAGDILKQMTRHRPQNRIDGMRNVWILKPGDKSLGKGIILKNSLKDILSKVQQAAKESLQYVVQKYIERPLLIYKTKIDIRQWFMITSTQPLIVWMYKDILIRFASRNFTLDDFHESIHLCNTTVQLKYRKAPRTNLRLPHEFHWNLQDFKNYLREKDQEAIWEKTIRPGIKQNLTGALLASQDNMVHRKHSFQLYGADFVITDDFSVWLIEINTNPRLYPPSSTVTAKLYPEVIEDAIKVVIDRRKNRRAPRGKFECIYKQRNPVNGVNVLGQGTCLGIKGKAIFPPLSTSQHSSPLNIASNSTKNR